MSFKVHFRQHFFLYFILLILVIVSIISYYRFIIKNDYLVGYEGECDPVSESCFIGCKDDSCINEYYSKVQKYAPDLFEECGADITDCAEASVCLPMDQKCSVTYCDPVIDGDICGNSTAEVDSNEDIDIASSTEDSLLLDNKNGNSL